MKIKASFKTSMLLIFGIGAIGGSVLAYYSFIPMLKHKYIQIVDLCLTLTAVTVSLSSLYYLLKNEVIHLNSKKLITRSFFGLVRNQYQLQDLKSYTTIQKSNKYIRWEDLDLYFLDKKLRITSSNLKRREYLKFKSLITRKVVENKAKRKAWENRSLKLFGAGFIIVWVLFAGIFINQDRSGNKPINESNTTLINGIITNDVKLKSDKKNKDALVLELNTFPLFSFKVNRPEIDALDTDNFLKETGKGKQISIKIWKDLYEKKIIESHKLTFAEKHFNYHEIDILGLSNEKHVYMLEKNVNKSRENFHTSANFYGLMAFAVFGIGLGIYFLILATKPDANML